MKKIIALLLAVLICVAMVGCNTNPTNNSDYSNNESDIIIEETITEIVSSNDSTATESTPSENVVSNTSSQTENANQETKNVIPEGGIYTCTNKGVVLTAGQEWPAQCEEYDVYTYGDYEYVYNIGIVYGGSGEIYLYDNTVSGWTVGVLDKKKTSYGEILDSINGKPIVSVGARKTNENVEIAGFSGCTKLVVAPNMPSTVVSMYYAFENCKALASVQNLPSSVIYMYGTFVDCSSLKKAPTIPDSVIAMPGAFCRCDSLETVPTLSKNIDDVESAFAGCTSLMGTITINFNPAKFSMCFFGVDMSKITLTGDATKETLNNLGATGENYTPIS